MHKALVLKDAIKWTGVSLKLRIKSLPRPTTERVT